MPAIRDEIVEAEREGIEFEFLAAPSRFVDEDGRLRGVECVRMTLGPPDSSGRRRPVPLAGGAFGIPADTVLKATGEDIDATTLPPEFAANGQVPTGYLGAILALQQQVADDRIDTDLLSKSKRPIFFAGGDVAGDERSVAHALGAGKRAAIGIDRALTTHRLPTNAGDGSDTLDDAAPLRLGPLGNVSMTRWRNDDPVRRTAPVNDVVGYDQLNIHHFEHVRTHADHQLPPWMLGFDEVNLGISWESAMDEAKRCFNCGVCNECELCLIFCADVAISRREDGAGFDIDFEYCKGCGVCAEECPRGAIAMTREGL